MHKMTKNNELFLQLHTCFNYVSTWTHYYNVYIPAGDTQKVKDYVRRPEGTGKMTEKKSYV